jgi:hypothetical protein
MRRSLRPRACRSTVAGDNAMNPDNSITARLAFVRIDEATRAALRELRPLIMKELPAVLDRFYARIAKFPMVRAA